MIIWVDAQLSPRTARWIAANFSVTGSTARARFGDCRDEKIFAAAGSAKAVVLTKDIDFVRLLEQHGSPPKIIWLTCGNTSEAVLRRLLGQHLAMALTLLG